MAITQCEKILNFIQEHGSITTKQAYRLDIMRLASRISNLKAAGYKIKSEQVKVKNRDGSCSYVAEYSFLNPKDFESEV